MKGDNNLSHEQLLLAKSHKKEKNPFIVLAVLICLLSPLMIFIDSHIHIDYIIISAIWTSFFISVFLTLIFFTLADKNKDFKHHKSIGSDHGPISDTDKFYTPGHPPYDVFHHRD